MQAEDKEQTSKLRPDDSWRIAAILGCINKPTAGLGWHIKTVEQGIISRDIDGAEQIVAAAGLGESGQSAEVKRSQ